MKAIIQGDDSKIFITNKLVMVEPEFSSSFKLGEEVILKLSEGDNHGIVIDPLDKEANPYSEKWKVTYLKPKTKYPVNTKLHLKPLEYQIGIFDYLIISSIALMTIWCIWMFIKIL